jgi:hypothetical protein
VHLGDQLTLPGIGEPAQAARVAGPPMDVHGTLPWSVLRQDARTWQDRKRWWLALGVHDDAPRTGAGGMMATGRHGLLSGGLSRFDPHLAEVCYRWYCPPGGRVLDPTAGGPVRGLVAGHLGYEYLGVDLLESQVDANRQAALGWQQAGLLGDLSPLWVHGDAVDALPRMSSARYDYALSCPPYHNRERYNAGPGDLSGMPWPAFLVAHAAIVSETVRLLRPDRFATWVVSDIRDHRGHLRGFPARVMGHFEAAGAHLVNEQILITPVGTAHKRMRPPWTAARTATRLHQVVLTFVKGSRQMATLAVRGGDDDRA